MKRPRIIISIDGGGILGMIPAMVLAEIERRTCRHTVDYASLFGGTSTGGILACALAQPNGKVPARSAEEIPALYRDKGPEIFHRSFWYRIKSGDGYMAPKYPIDGLARVMREYMGKVRMSEALRPTFVTTYDLAASTPLFIKSHTNGVSFYMADAVIATAAAPSYFPPHQVGPHVLIDGGIFAKNPAICAWREAVGLWGLDQPYIVLSLGTGMNDHPVSYDVAKGAGPIGLIKDVGIIGRTMDGQCDTANHIMEGLPNTTFIRLDYRMTVEGRMDDASKDNLNKLEKAGQKLIQKNSDTLDWLCDTIRSGIMV